MEVLKVLLDDVTDSINGLVDLDTIWDAANTGDIEMIKYFEEKLPKHSLVRLFTIKAYEYGTIFHNLAVKGHLEMVKYLCQTRNPIEKNILGRTPIHYAAQNGHLEIVKFLTLFTSNPNSPDNSGWIPSDYAKFKGFLVNLFKTGSK